RRAELEEPLQTIVAVDDAAVQIVQVARREPATVELHHRAQVRRDDRQDAEDHPLGRRAAAKERLDEAQSLDGLLAALARRGAHLALEPQRVLLEIHLAHELEDRLGAHLRAEEPELVRGLTRSEERRVGKECRGRWAA